MNRTTPIPQQAAFPAMKFLLGIVLAGAWIAAPVFAATLSELTSEDARTRAFAVRDLGEAGGPQAVAPLADMLGDANVFVRAAAMQALHSLGENTLREEVKDALLAALETENHRARSGAAETLGMLRVEAAADPLIALLTDDEATVQHAAACALARLQAQQAIDSLIAVVSDTGAAPFARMGAAWALGELEADAAVAPLVAVVQDGRSGQWHYTSVGVYATEALGKINNPACVPGLVEALAIDGRHLRAQLAITLAEITGEDFGENREKWEAYVQEAF